MQRKNIIKISEPLLINEISQLIEQARNRFAQAANTEITLLYWHIGERINRDVLENQRAEYGKKIVSQLATQLVESYGREFELRNLRRMMQFAKQFPILQIVSQAATQLSWSHFVELLPIKEDLQREFYLTMAMHDKWTRNTLRSKIGGMLYERTIISGKPDEIIINELSDLRDNNKITPDLVFKSPYFLNFTGLKGFYSEKTLEDVLIAEIERFIMELGCGFSFIERQKRMIIDGEDFFLDLLFYHRKLKRLIHIF